MQQKDSFFFLNQIFGCISYFLVNYFFKCFLEMIFGTFWKNGDFLQINFNTKLFFPEATNSQMCKIESHYIK